MKQRNPWRGRTKRRGQCPTCGDSIVARLDGTLRAHQGRDGYVTPPAAPEPDRPARRVPCGICGKPCDAAGAHLHQGEWIGDECCWDERLRSSE